MGPKMTWVYNLQYKVTLSEIRDVKQAQSDDNFFSNLKHINPQIQFTLRLSRLTQGREEKGE